MAERPRHPLVPALVALLALLLPGAGLGAPERSWYQVEIVLFENASAAARTAETLGSATRASQSAAAVALAPPWPGHPRPSRTAELEMLWHSAGSAPRLVRLSPGLDPETELIIAWLQRLNARTAAPDLAWLEDLASLRWKPDVPGSLPVPEIRPQVSYERLTPAAEAPEPLGDDAPIAPPMALAFRQVPGDQLLLAEDAAHLRRARDFRVLAHLAWRQPFELEAAPVPVLVRWRDPATDALRLAGSIGVALRRYLHVDVDLAWLESEGEREGEGEGEGLDAEAEEELTPWAPIVQSRRMRSNETHYVDHPRVGALIRITPFALARPLTDEAPPAPAFGD